MCGLHRLLNDIEQVFAQLAQVDLTPFESLLSLFPRLYYDYGNGFPGAFIVEAGVEWTVGGDPCGRLFPPVSSWNLPLVSWAGGVSR